MGKSKVVLPKRLTADPRVMGRIITNTLNAVALAVKADFGVTVQTWKDKPTFAISNPTPYQRQISTDDPIYTMLNDGTRAHLIRPKAGGVLVFKTPFRSKTVPRTIASGPGASGGNTIFTARPIQHPGTKARAWDKTIQEKWDKRFAQTMQRAIDSEV